MSLHQQRALYIIQTKMWEFLFEKLLKYSLFSVIPRILKARFGVIQAAVTCDIWPQLQGIARLAGVICRFGFGLPATHRVTRELLSVNGIKRDSPWPMARRGCGHGRMADSIGQRLSSRRCCRSISSHGWRCHRAAGWIALGSVRPEASRAAIWLVVPVARADLALCSTGSLARHERDGLRRSGAAPQPVSV